MRARRAPPSRQLGASVWCGERAEPDGRYRPSAPSTDLGMCPFADKVYQIQLCLFSFALLAKNIGRSRAPCHRGSFSRSSFVAVYSRNPLTTKPASSNLCIYVVIVRWYFFDREHEASAELECRVDVRQELLENVRREIVERHPRRHPRSSTRSSGNRADHGHQDGPFRCAIVALLLTGQVEVVSEEGRVVVDGHFLAQVAAT
jgi:hypothetical protein